MDQQIFTYVLLAALAMALLVAAFTDLKSRTIGNKLNLAIAAGAPLFWWTTGLDLWPGVAIQFGIAGVTFAVCALFFAIRQMGGGDVKLLTALALWFPPTNFLGLVLIMAMLGWVLTLVMGIWGVARSNVVGAKPVRDTALLIACTLIAANFASAVLGGPEAGHPPASHRFARFEPERPQSFWRWCRSRFSPWSHWHRFASSAVTTIPHAFPTASPSRWPVCGSSAVVSFQELRLLRRAETRF